jgi:hypothetical protein
MSTYKDKMLGLRKSTTQALDEPKPAYRVMSVDPKGGNIDDQFALIESTQAYGSPASDSSMRKIRVGDSLPEGEVTAITGKGIQVIPDYGDEYVIPLGERPGYKPPTKKKSPPVRVKPPLESVFETADKLGVDPKTAAMLTTTGHKASAKHISDEVRDFLDEQGISQTFVPEDESIVSEQGLKIREEALDHKLAEDTLGVDDISDIIDQHQKDFVYSGVDENDLGDAALSDLIRDHDNKYEMWSGDGPEGEGRVVFYTNDDDETTGYWLRDGRQPQNVTGMLFPPTE